jgi:hypothetical protein
MNAGGRGSRLPKRVVQREPERPLRSDSRTARKAQLPRPRDPRLGQRPRMTPERSSFDRRAGADTIVGSWERAVSRAPHGAEVLTERIGLESEPGEAKIAVIQIGGRALAGTLLGPPFYLSARLGRQPSDPCGQGRTTRMNRVICAGLTSGPSGATLRGPREIGSGIATAALG